MASCSRQPDLVEVARVAKQQPFVHGSHNLSGKVEWYTPLEYIVSARRVMGSIDCDPCTSELAQKVVQAKTYYTIETNGLSHPWRGTVWMNPPYAARCIVPFVERLLGYLASGEVTQAIMLTHNNADTLWFHKAANRCTAACFTRGRVRFYDEHGTANAPTHGHCFMYFGGRERKFCDEFRQYGWIVKGAE